jgi:hypothetical protein
MRTLGIVLSVSIALPFALIAFGALPMASGCGSKSTGFSADDAGGPGTFGDSQAPPPCVNLQCQQVSCPSGTTSVSGTVYDPAGKNPLYNVAVYVPNAPVTPFTAGVSCDRCGTVPSGSPVTTTLTDPQGHFVLQNVPAGKNIPLVLQVGRWRRQITLPEVQACTETKLTDKDQTRLPRNQSEGDLPRMAITTGGCDPLACLFRKVGIDASEFTSSFAGGRMHVYIGVDGNGAPGSDSATALWDDVSHLKQYDIVILSCECEEHRETKSAGALQAMHDYASSGGRIFATHYHYWWLMGGPQDFSSVATWAPDSNIGIAPPYMVDTSFPKGQAYAAWLSNVKATDANGNVLLSPKTVSGDLSTLYPPSQRWIYTDKATKYFSFNTPRNSPPEQQCGRFVFSDIHLSYGSSTGDPVPTGCDTSDLTPQEKALEFLFFDLSACVQEDSKPPAPPPIK